eukprot:TRINITY_DN17596_c0_g1_i2.p1 TRINITY_DN17596_c0_g1~~TRINITY_DN17596_c0_g1_i2.p1  ORF type:complete len:228 (+),score=57.73 TRINITY_DN17596_c0_g1_i2:59-685(+)
MALSRTSTMLCAMLLSAVAPEAAVARGIVHFRSWQRPQAAPMLINIRQREFNATAAPAANATAVAANATVTTITPTMASYPNPHPHMPVAASVETAPLVAYRTDTHRDADSAEQSAAIAQANLEHAKQALKVTSSSAEVVTSTASQLSNKTQKIEHLYTPALSYTVNGSDGSARPALRASQKEDSRSGAQRAAATGIAIMALALAASA